MSALAISPDELNWNPVDGLARYARARSVVHNHPSKAEILAKAQEAERQQLAQQAKAKAEQDEAIRKFLARKRQEELEAKARAEMLKAQEQARIDLEARERNAEILPPQPSINRKIIARYVCEKYGVKWTDVISSRRTLAVVLPRQIIAYLCREYTLRSLPEIGQFLGGRDHTTILHAWRKIAPMVETGLLEVPSRDDLLLFEAMLKAGSETP